MTYAAPALTMIRHMSARARRVNVDACITLRACRSTPDSLVITAETTAAAHADTSRPSSARSLCVAWLCEPATATAIVGVTCILGRDVIPYQRRNFVRRFPSSPPITALQPRAADPTASTARLLPAGLGEFTARRTPTSPSNGPA